MSQRTDQIDDPDGERPVPALAPSRRAFLAGTAALGASVAGVPSVAAHPEERPPEPDVARSEEGMVASVHPQATDVGARVLANGGNAVDAAVAVQLALNVTQPHSSGIGGGGFMLVYLAEEDEVYAVDNRERAPMGASKEMFLDDEGEPIPFGDRIALGEAVGVPGTLRAADVALKRFGTRELAQLIEPAISLASPAGTTVRVDGNLASAIEGNRDRFNDAAKEVFVPDGDPLVEGDRLDQPDLASTLRQIRDEGPGAFYKGEIAEAVADAVQERGGSMTPADLARYNVTIDHPEYAEFGGLTVRTMSLPSSGGLTIGQILSLIEPFELGDGDARDPAKYHALIEAANLAYADRGEYMGDKALVDVPWQGLFDEEYLSNRRGLIPSYYASSDPPEPGDPWSYQPGEPYRVRAPSIGDEAPVGAGEDASHTTHFTVADSEGNLVSWTSTVEQFFGTGIVVPDHGFVLNNELTDFDAEPGGPNEVAPTKRPLSSTSPTIVFQDGEPFMTVGSPGGKTIITTVAQVILNVAAFDMSLPEAIREPRIYNDTDPEVLWESGIPASVRKNLRERGHQLRDDPFALGNVQAIRIEDGEYVGVADGRRQGRARGP